MSPVLEMEALVFLDQALRTHKVGKESSGILDGESPVAGQTWKEAFQLFEGDGTLFLMNPKCR